MKKGLVMLIAAGILMLAASGCDNRTTSSQNSGTSEEQSSQTSQSEPSNSDTSSDSIPHQTDNEQSGGTDTPLDSSSDGTNSSESTPAVSDTRAQIVAMAEAMVGIDFVSGGASPQDGFDNSGLIYYVLRENGYINCPRSTAEQKNMGTEVAFDDLQPGDLVFFSDLDMQTGEKNDFGGIYVGEGKLIYSPYPGEKVKFADINSAYWKNSFCCAVSVC